VTAVDAKGRRGLTRAQLFDDNRKLFRISTALQGFSVAAVLDAGMYAIIKTGGKQYRVAVGDKVRVESLAGDVGQQLRLEHVLAIGSGGELRTGNPLVGGAAVLATVLSHGRGDKVRIFKMRRRKHFKKQQGHRQNFTELRIDALS
jgi:large subunit ribosomal protein L21